MNWSRCSHTPRATRHTPAFPLPNGAVLTLGHPDARTLDTVLACFSRSPLSYATPGMTAWSSPPAGMQAEASAWALGTGTAAFEGAGAALFAWATHDLRWRGGQWLDLHADGPPEPGRTVVLVLGLGPWRYLCGCRVLEAWRTETAQGYRYGTLPGHPEAGEESFSVKRKGDAVTLHLLAHSRPAGLLWALGRPLSLALRRLGSRGYGRQLARAARTAEQAAVQAAGRVAG